MSATGATACKFNVFWLIFPVFLLQRKCDTCIATSGCRYFHNESKYSCSETLWDDQNSSNHDFEQMKNTKVLELCNISSDTLNLSALSEDFPSVINVTIWKGNVTRLTGRFAPKSKIEVLQLRDLLIEELPYDFLEPLEDIKTLRLSKNYLRTLNNDALEAINKIPVVNLADNHWDCTSSLEWVLKLNAAAVADINEMKCYGDPYPEKAMLPIALFKKNVISNCPPECECSMPNVVIDPTNFRLKPIIEVNCSDRGLTELPSILPNKTMILMLERNNIRNLEPLIKNPIYRSVQDLHLDNNFIATIKDLEGVYWLSHFRVLSLRNNRLTQLPTYALDNALQQNPNMPMAVRIYLGGNPWRCDCVFTPGFQEMLRKYEMQVKDTDDIRCSYLEGDENSLALILELSRSSVCRLPSQYSVQALDLLNGVLASLIVLILGKLAYDYYYFKKTGRLPWIVTKMP